jgi:hypothetical protein
MRTMSLVHGAFVLCLGAVLGRLSVVRARCLGLLLMMACTSYTRGDVFRVDGLGTHRFECLDRQLTPLFERGRSWVPIRYAFGNPCHRAAALVRARASAVAASALTLSVGIPTAPCLRRPYHDVSQVPGRHADRRHRDRCRRYSRCPWHNPACATAAAVTTA